ncbi:MAG: hypothetical protein JO227_18765 [Acetobacteraceae bacterium]|nr:hypothetical protein [Acetobacteraceae bacterium]
MDIGAWLRALGLGQYEQVFRDNAIDAEVLSNLTDNELASLGIRPGDTAGNFCARSQPWKYPDRQLSWPTVLQILLRNVGGFRFCSPISWARRNSREGLTQRTYGQF